VLHLAGHYYAHNSPLFNPGDATAPLEGALHALLEQQRSVDVLTEDAALERMHEYRLVVVPEQTYISLGLQSVLENYARAGGNVLISGAHIAREYPDLVGAAPAGDPVGMPAIPSGVAAQYLPLGERAVSVNGPWQPVRPREDTEVWIERLDNHEPSKDHTGEAVVTCRRIGTGAILGIHGDMFHDYYRGHYPLLRTLIGTLVERLNITWAVEAGGPARLELVLRWRGTDLLINLINRGAGEALSARRVIVEELPPITNIILRVPRSTAPNAVTVAPGGAHIDWTYDNGTVTIQAPRLDIHMVIVVS